MSDTDTIQSEPAEIITFATSKQQQKSYRDYAVASGLLQVGELFGELRDGELHNPVLVLPYGERRGKIGDYRYDTGFMIRATDFFGGRSGLGFIQFQIQLLERKLSRLKHDELVCIQNGGILPSQEEKKSVAAAARSAAKAVAKADSAATVEA